MNITPEIVHRVRCAMKEYDSTTDAEARVAAGLRLEASVDGLSDKQIPQVIKLALKGA